MGRTGSASCWKTSASELAADGEALRGAPEEAFADRKGFRLADVYEQTINTLTKRPLIGFLANRNVLPKYGFPTDTVELRTALHGRCRGRAGWNCRATCPRPSTSTRRVAEIVAGGRLWTSGGVYRLPERELISRTTRYARLRPLPGRRRAARADLPIVRCMCRPGFRAILRDPEFGFVAERDPERPGLTAPQRCWNGATYVLSLGAEVAHGTWPLASGGSGQPRGRAAGPLVAISDGPGGAGYLICDWCGWGTARAAARSRPSPTSTRSALGTVPARYGCARSRINTRPTCWRSPSAGTPQVPGTPASGARSCTRCSKAPPIGWKSAATTSTAPCTPSPTGDRRS